MKALALLLLLAGCTTNVTNMTEARLVPPVADAEAPEAASEASPDAGDPSDASNRDANVPEVSTQPEASADAPPDVVSVDAGADIEQPDALANCSALPPSNPWYLDCQEPGGYVCPGMCPSGFTTFQIVNGVATCCAP